MLKIYIAGPDVFEKNSLEIGKELSSLCEKYNYKGLYPLDNIADFNQEKRKIADDIFIANVAFIKDADIVIANLNPFRGKEADSGTVWECGFAYGLGKKVYGYMDDTRPYIDKFNPSEKESENGMVFDKDEKAIEDFNHPLNLMIACSAMEIVQGSFEDVLKKISKSTSKKEI